MNNPAKKEVEILNGTYPLVYKRTDKYSCLYYQCEEELYKKINSVLPDYKKSCLHTYNDRYYIKSKNIGKFKKNDDKGEMSDYDLKFYTYEFATDAGETIKGVSVRIV